MRKGMIIGLACLLVLGLSGMAMAAVPPAVHTTVTFEGANPDVMVMSQATLKAGYSDFRETSVFTLTGDGDAVGVITGSATTYHCCRTLPIATVSGGYTASNGDFQSTFESSNLNWKSNPFSTTTPEFASATFYSQHNLSATGLPDEPITIDPVSGAVSGGSMTVSGNATAKCGWGEPLSVEQSFGGKALEVEVSGLNRRYPMDVDPVSLKPNLDPVGDFQFLSASDMVTVDVVGSALGSSPIDFGGQTGGQYRTYTAPPGNNSNLRSSSIDYDVWLQESPTIYPNPLTAVVYVYAPDASSMVINAWTTTTPTTEVWGNVIYSY